jgi:hypothetical protein
MNGFNPRWVEGWRRREATGAPPKQLRLHFAGGRLDCREKEKVVVGVERRQRKMLVFPRKNNNFSRLNQKH